MVSNFEVEFKYGTDSKLSLPQFKKFIKRLEKREKAQIIKGKSPDYYYSKPYVDNSFFRFRDGKSPELTKKVKLRKRNNWLRIEIDLPLDEKRIEKGTVDALMKIEGYKFNFSIIKEFWVAKFKEVNFVYYTVFSAKGKKLRTFIEVEINKDYMKKKTTLAKYIKLLETYEEELLVLGLTKQDRVKDSIFEIFRKF